MFEVKYDILDDMTALQSNAVQKVIDEEPVRTPEDFYREFSETECTHLLTCRFFFNGDKRDYIPKMQELIDELLRVRYPGVPQCQFVDSSTLNTNTRSSIEILKENAYKEKIATETKNNKYVTAKIPLKFTGNKRRDIFCLLNFFTALHSAISVRYVYNLQMKDYIFYQPSGYKIYITHSGDNAWNTKRKMYRFSNSNEEDYRLWAIWAVINYLYSDDNFEDTGNIVKSWFYKYNDSKDNRNKTFDELSSISCWRNNKIKLNSSVEAKERKYYTV